MGFATIPLYYNPVVPPFKTFTKQTDPQITLVKGGLRKGGSR